MRKIELAEEILRIGTRKVKKGLVRVHTETDSFDTSESIDVENVTVEVCRIPVGRPIDAVPLPRQEGTTTILSVVEEVLVVRKQLVLKEEIHIRRITTRTKVDVPAKVRRQRAVVERFGGPGQVLTTEILKDPPEADHPTLQKETTMTISDISMTADNSLSAFFDTKSEAERALERLRAAGIAEANLRLTEGTQHTDGDLRDENVQPRQKGFFEALENFFFPEEDRYAYAEGLSRGGFLVTVVDLPESQRVEALDILDDEGAVNLDEREAAWRSEGWTGNGSAQTGLLNDFSTQDDPDQSARPMATGFAESAPGLTPKPAVAGDDRTAVGEDVAPLDAPRTGAAESAEPGFAEAQGETIPVIEEQLRVGKRDTSHGRVRVRSYVREKPASAEVELRDERVEVQRRGVDRPVTDADEAFRDQVIEAEEHREEAVVSKEARIVEEIELRKHQEARKETITDTVRHTEVEIEDDRVDADDAPSRR